MTPIEAEILVKGGESLTVEFKSDVREPLSDKDLIEAVVCLANREPSEGAWLVIGVEDDGSITGSRTRHQDGTDPSLITSLIRSRSNPPLSCSVELVDHGEKQLLFIKVPKATSPISTSDGRYIHRVIGADGRPACEPWSFVEMMGGGQTPGAVQDYSRMILPEASMDDLDPVELDRLRGIVGQSPTVGDGALASLDDTDLLKALNVIEGSSPPYSITVAAILLFGKESKIQSLIPTHEIAFQVLSDVDVQLNIFSRSPLLRIMEDFLVRFQVMNREKEIMIKGSRYAVPDISERAFREALANALIHRDYRSLGSVHIQFQEGELIVSSPGGFPEGVGVNNVLVTPPTPRNPLLADAFKRAGFVERTGRGIDTIFYQQVRFGRPAPSYEQSTGRAVVLSIPKGNANLSFVQFVIEETSEKESLNLAELLVLNHVWLWRRISAEEVSELTQRPLSFSRSVFQHLVERGLLVRSGEYGKQDYALPASIYQQFGDEAAYVRQAGYEPSRHKDLITRYVQENDSISRSEAAELCRIAPKQAGKLLKELTDSGELQLKGEKRGSYYVLP